MQPTPTPTRAEVVRYFLGLGFVNIGGPVAQITMLFQGIVERRRWIDRDRFVRMMSVCHVLPGPEALQLAIYVGYLTGRTWGGIVAGVTFIVPGAIVMTALAAAYVAFGALPAVNDALYVLKPAVFGIIAAGLAKIGRAAIRDLRLAVIALLGFGLVWLARLDVLIVLAAAAFANVATRRRVRPPPAVVSVGPLLALTPAGWLDFAWAFLKTGLFSFGGAYGSIAFLQQEAVAERGWISASQLLDGVALSVATPGPFMLFATFVGYLVAGVPGAIVATAAIFVPSFVFILALARWIEPALERPLFREAIAGISAAVVAIILSVTIALAPAAVTDPITALIALASLTAVAIFKRDVALVAAVAMALGVLFAAVRSG